MSDVATPQDVHQYWFETLSQKEWYVASDAVDDTIRARFLPTWEAAARGDCEDWRTSAQGALAYLIVVDQFSRNMFRADGRAFATDAQGLTAARDAIGQGWDLEITGDARQFMYMPLMHSEELADQDDAIALFEERMPGGPNTLHAHAHRWVIATFGRFPYRNAALGRETTAEEQAFLDNGGYRFAVATVEGKADARD